MNRIIKRMNNNKTASLKSRLKQIIDIDLLECNQLVSDARSNLIAIIKRINDKLGYPLIDNAQHESVIKAVEALNREIALIDEAINAEINHETFTDSE